MVRKILPKVSDETIRKDLERYRQMALDLGATDAKIIMADQIIFDERVHMKCLAPKCVMYNTNAQCPPYAPDPDLARKAVERYEYAIFFQLKTPSEELCGPRVTELRKSVPSGLKIGEIGSKIESTAFYDGYYLAIAFGAVPCKLAYCPNVECAALTPGQACRHPYKARPTIDHFGIDGFLMASRVGWDVYPCGMSAKPEDVPHGTRLGLVLIC